MPNQPNKFSEFWNELKRRKVVRVIIGYATSAFILLQVVDLIITHLHLPDWVGTFSVILILVGFPITVILSWIFDITPQGIEVTKQSEETEEKETTKFFSRKNLVSNIIMGLFFVAVIILAFPKIVKNNAGNEIEKSIAVLPFKLLSDETDKQYEADGMMEAIRLHLSKIEDLLVMPRTSVEQYRNTKMTINDICEEMGVSYVMEGSFQKSGDQIRLIVTLNQIGKKSTVWDGNYDREWKDVFTVQSEVAQIVAGELQAVISPEVKKQIEKKPTTDLTAYDFYVRALDKHLNGNNQIARELLKKALKYDSTYAEAYALLGGLYEDRDSGLILVNIALSYNENLPLAYVSKGQILRDLGKSDQSILEYEKAAECDPNSFLAHNSIGQYYRTRDWVKAFNAFEKAVKLSSGRFRINPLLNLSNAYYDAGFRDKAFGYYNQWVELTGEKLRYYFTLAGYEVEAGNYTQTIEYCQAALEMDSIYGALYYIGWSYYKMGRNNESLKYMKTAIEKTQVQEGGELFIRKFGERIAYAYWLNGFKEETDYYLNIYLEYLLEIEKINYSNHYVQYALASVYAFRGETEKALENLRQVNQQKIIGFGIADFIKRDELFDPIRENPEFQHIVKEMNTKYQAEHERVRQWLEEKNTQ